MLTTAGDKKVSIEFPINHINVKRETRQWQLETGPTGEPHWVKMKGRPIVCQRLIISTVSTEWISLVIIYSGAQP